MSEKDLLSSEDPAVRIGAARELGQRPGTRAAQSRLLLRLEVEEDAPVVAALAEALLRHATVETAEVLIPRLWRLKHAALGPRGDAARQLLRDIGEKIGWAPDRVESAGQRATAHAIPRGAGESGGSHRVQPAAPSGDPVDQARERLAQSDRVAAIKLLQEAVRTRHPRAKLAAAWLGALLLSQGQNALALEYFAASLGEPRPLQPELDRVRAFCRDRGLVPLPDALRELREPDRPRSVSSLTTDGIVDDSAGIDSVSMARAQIPDRFADVSHLGTGGMGVVFQARDRELERLVAIKMLLPAHWNDQRSLKRFVREARALARLDHPAILKIHDIYRNEVPFFSMELLEGSTLEALLVDGLPPVPKLAAYLLPVLDALDHCHATGLVHRDVKPRNVFITAGGEARLMDFGIVKSVGATSMTRQGTVIGTPRYMAPEQLLGGKIDHRSDIYAFGVSLFQMLTGVLPFRDPGEIFARPAPSVRDWIDIPEPLAAIVARCLERNPASRYPTCRAVYIDLEPFAASEAPSVTYTPREAFLAVVIESLKPGAIAGNAQVVSAARHVLGLTVEAHREIFAEAQERMRRGGALPAVAGETLYRLVAGCHLRNGGDIAIEDLDQLGRLLEVARPRRRQLERELREELTLEASMIPGRGVRRRRD